MNKWIFTLITVFLFQTFVFSQNRTNKCLEFEELELDFMYSVANDYTIGDQLFEDGGITATLQPFLYSNGTTDLFGITVLDNPFGLQRPDFSKGLFISNANALFDFTGFSEDVVRVSLRFADGGGEENLSINGEDIRVVPRLSELHGTTIGGVEIIVRTDSSDVVEQGVLVLEGAIRSISIGGQELFIDNVCARTSEAEDCIIENLSVRPLECLDNGRYIAAVNFEYDGADNELFDIYLNDSFLGTKNLADLPIEYDFLYSNIQNEMVLTVCINDRPNCCAQISFEQPDCDNISDCSIELFEAYPTECDSNGNFMVNFFIAAQDGSAEGFFITDVFRERFGPFSYADSILVLGPYSDLDDVPHVFTLFDAADENCTAQTELFGICNNGPCWIEDVFFEPHPCDENGQYLLDIVVTARNVSEAGFYVEYFGERFGPFSYQEPFITVGPLSVGYDVPTEIRIADSEMEGCEYSEIITPPCGIDCDLTSRAVLTACTDDGRFYAELFITGGTGHYQVNANGIDWGPFTQADSVIAIGPFLTSNESFLVAITDQNIPFCVDTLVLEAPCIVDNCNIGEVLTVSSACKDNGAFDLLVVLDSTGIYTDSIGIRYQDRFMERSIDEFPLTLRNFRYSEDDFIEICLLGEVNCCTPVRFEVPDGCDEDCPLENAVVTPQTCDADNQFFVNVEIPFSEPLNYDFYIAVGNEGYGPFTDADSVIQIGPFDGNIEILRSILIYNITGRPCRYEGTFDSPCFNSSCEIEANISPQPCDEEGFFYVGIAAWNNATNSDSFHISIFDQDYGAYSYLDSLIEIGPFDGNTDEVYEIIISDHDAAGCFVAETFVSPCTANECVIRNLTVETTECLDSNTVNLVIDFEVEGAENEFFDLYYQNELIGFYAIADLPITVENFYFEERPNSTHLLRVCVNDNRDCCARIELTNPCTSSDCHITNVVAEPLLCENNEFKVDLFVQTNQPNPTGYFVQINNGALFGPFSYEQEYITIGPFEGDGSTTYRVTVIDGEDRSCRNGTRFRAVDCSASCHIDDLTLEVGEACNEDGTFSLTVDFDIQNPIGFGFSIYADRDLIGTYPYGNVPTYFPRFNINGRSTATISVIAGGDRNCAMRKILQAPECSVDTSDLWPGDTNNDGIAHFKDLLNIGLAYGETGPVRIDSSLAWRAQQAPNWTNSFENGINYKYADANGDGIINEEDVQVIELNYNQLQDETATEPGVDEEEVEATEGDPSIFVDLPESGEFPNGTAFSVPIILGSEANSVESVYGIAFTVQYNPNVIDPNEVKITIPDSWIGDVEEDLLMIQRSYPQEGLMEVAISRKDRESVRGYGVIALMSGIIVDIVGFRTVEVGIKEVRAVKSNGAVIPIFPASRVTKITTSSSNWKKSKIKVYPNPVSETLYLNPANTDTIEQVEIMTLQGKIIERFIKPEGEISVAHIPDGIYILNIQSGKEFYHQHIIKQ